MKAKFCADGNRRMYEYCQKFNVPHINTGKFIVATSSNEIPKLEEIFSKAEYNGVEGIERVTGNYVASKEPLVECIEALFVPSSGIVDQNSLMRSYLGELEESSGNIVFNSQFLRSEIHGDKYCSTVLSDGEEIIIESSVIINAAGLNAENIANNILPLDKKNIPKTYFAKGNYFETGKDLKIRHLIYPIPNDASLGLLLGLDLGMQVRFGPDVEWVDEIDYEVKKDRQVLFHNDVIKYIPSIKIEDLKAGYSGVRPKLKNKGEGKSDFSIQGEKTHGIKNLVNLFGMESPGLTSSLVIGEYVTNMVSLKRNSFFCEFDIYDFIFIIAPFSICLTRSLEIFNSLPSISSVLTSSERCLSLIIFTSLSSSISKVCFIKSFLKFT